MRNKFLILLAQKEMREARRIKYGEIVAETGIAFSTVTRWVRNEVTKVEGPVIEAFCAYFDCDIGDLLYIDPNATNEKKSADSDE